MVPIRPSMRSNFVRAPGIRYAKRMDAVKNGEGLITEFIPN
jgi:hypothetical protein